jgi:hypothetical protein
MRWRGRHEWPDRPARPKVRRLSAEERSKYLTGIIRAIERSPILSALNVEVHALRGRFYMERCYWQDGTLIGTATLGRITPLTDSAASLLLEVEHRKGSWSEIAKGSVQKVMNAIANDTKGTFHGLGSLNKSLQKAGKGLQRLPVKMRGKVRFVFSETGQQCSTQEALFHYFGMPVDVIAKPRTWYWYHRKPHIIEVSRDRQRVLVRFSTSSLSGEFGGTCLYICRDGKWDAYTIRPNQSSDIASAEKWLEKRKWRAWT